MFIFKDKTIQQMRDEILASLGKVVMRRDGFPIKIDRVSQCGVYWWWGMVIGSPSKEEYIEGKGSKHYGFTVYYTLNDGGSSYTDYERIHIGYSKRDEKYTIIMGSQATILHNEEDARYMPKKVTK